MKIILSETEMVTAVREYAERVNLHYEELDRLRAAASTPPSPQAAPSLLTDKELTDAWNAAVPASHGMGVEMYLHLIRAVAIAQHAKDTAALSHTVPMQCHDCGSHSDAMCPKQPCRMVACAPSAIEPRKE